MKRPALWIVLAAVSVMAAWVGIQYFPRAFSIVALNITMDRERALAEARDVDGARDVRTSRLPPGGLVRRRRRSADVRGARGRRQGRLHADAARAALRGIHLARAALQGGRNQRDDDPVHAGRPAVRLRRAAQGGCARRRARRSGGARDCRGRRRRGGMSIFASSTLVEQGQERRPSGRVDHTFTYERTSDNLEGGPVPPAARRLRRSADGSHSLHQDPRVVHPPLREHALGQRSDRRRIGRRAWRSSTSSAASASACSS